MKNFVNSMAKEKDAISWHNELDRLLTKYFAKSNRNTVNQKLVEKALSAQSNYAS